MATVWVPHRVTLNISAAENFGDLHYVNDRYIYGDEIDGHNPPFGFRRNIERAAVQFDPKHDYLLLVGDDLQKVMLASQLARLYPSFNVLRYDRQAEGYFPVRISSDLTS